MVQSRQEKTTYLGKEIVFKTHGSQVVFMSSGTFYQNTLKVYMHYPLAVNVSCLDFLLLSGSHLSDSFTLPRLCLRQLYVTLIM